MRDLRSGRARAELTAAGRPSSRTSFSPALAAQAAVAAVPSFAYDLGPTDRNRRVDVYRRSAETGRTQRMSR